MSRGLIVNSNLELNHKPRAFNLRGPENTDHLSTEGTHSPSDKYPTNITPQMPFFGERRYYQDCPVEDVAARTETKMVPKKASKENLLRAGQRGRTRTIREL
ncbi:hypothetical protein ACTXT7_010660 [Hymenolepis weldensis]